MNSTEIFTLALNLGSPWLIKEINMIRPSETFAGQMDIYIDFKPGSKFQDSVGANCSVYDTVEKTWQHLNFFEHKCYLHARVPRITNSDGKVEQVKVPWARPQSGFTLLFEAFSMLLIESEMPVRQAAKILKIYDTRLWRIFKYWLSKALSADDQSELVNIGIDETSSKKGHNYVTIAVDMDARRVIFAKSGKGSNLLSDIKEHLQSKGCNSEQIKNISMDMSPAFISGALENFPKAAITFDKFHIMQLVNKAMDDVRKYERKQHVELKNHKYLFLRNSENLTRAEQAVISYFTNLYQDLGKAYRLKELFREFWDIENVEGAEEYLEGWCYLADNSAIMPFMNLSKTIKAHWSGILNYFKSGLNNGILEGINSKIQLAKKRARGFCNIDNFISMIHFVAGKLKFEYPLYLM